MTINTIGDSQKDLVLLFLERLVFKRGNKEIEVLDRDGNPNIKFKNTLKNGIPTSSSEDGFYYDGTDIYIKSGDNIINITKSCIPENVILMYKGNTPPEGWVDYGGETGISGVMYITNGTGRDIIKLQFNIGPDYPSSLVVGLKYDLPSIRVTKDGSAYTNYSYNEIRFLSSDTSIVKIENNKLVALKSGTVNIIVEIDENFTHTGDRIQYKLPVNVKQIPDFYFNHTAYSFNVGDWHHFGVDISGLDDSLINELIFEDISNINPKSISEYHLFETAGTYYIKARLPLNEYHSAAETTNEMVVTVISSSKPQPNISFNGNEGHANARGEGISTPTLINPNNVTVTYSSSNTSVATVDNNGNINIVGAGTTIITATFAGNNQYAPQSISYTLTINPIVVTNPTIELSQNSYTYDGNAKTPTVTVKDGNVTILSTEYTVSYSNNTNVGTATVTITDKEGGNYTVNGSTTFTITSKPIATITKAPTGITNLVADETSKDLINKGEASNGVIMYCISDSQPTDKNLFNLNIPTATESGTYKVWYYAKGNSGYDDSSISGPIEVTISESQQEEDEITKSVNVVANSIYDEGGSSVDDTHVKFKFVNNTGSTITEYWILLCDENGTWSSDLSKHGTVTWESGTTNELTFNSELNAYDSIGLWNTGNISVFTGNHETEYLANYYPENSGVKYEKGKCYTIIMKNPRQDYTNNTVSVSDNTSSQSVSDKNIVVTVKNNTENDLVLNGIIKFHGSGLDTGSNIKFSNSNVVIDSGSKYTSDKIEIDTNYRGRTLNKIIIYDSSNTPIEIGDLNTTLQMGATYNITYGEIKVNPGNADTFDTVISKFNRLDPLKNKEIEKNSQSTGNIYNYLEDMYNKAVIEYNDSNSILFKLETYPDIYTNSEYRGNNSEYEGGLALNAMTYWLMAMCLTELLASKNNDSNFDISTGTNNQTKFFKLAYDLGNEDGYGKSIPLYGGFTLKGDPNICRLAASAVYAMYRGENDGQHTYSEISSYRDILGGSVIETSNLSELDFTTSNNPIWFKLIGLPENLDHVDCDWDGNKASRTVTKLGYAVNTYNIFPNSPGPRISNTSVLDLDLPQNQGQDSSLFNSNTNNYIIDEHIDDYICDNYNIMDYEKKSLWDNYSLDLKNRLIRAVASMSCSRKSMFCGDIKISEMNEPWVEYNPSEYGDKDTNCGKYWIHRFEKNSNGDLTLSSPFGINSNLYRDWVDKTNNLNNVERYINCITDFADNMRFPTFCPNTGRRRPGDGNEIENTLGRGGTPGNYRNELYNLDISEMVVDTYAQLAKAGFGKENGYAQQAPHSYPSGHSAQTWALALALTSANPKDILTYLKGAYEYSINRTICRCHWNSDIIYGRLFGTITIPIINIVSSIKDGYDDMKSYIENGNVSAEITFNITNTSGSSISCSGRMGVILSGAGFIHPIDKKEYAYYRISNGQCELWNLDSGQSLSITVSFANDKDYESWMNNFNFANENECTAGGRKSNVAFYDENGVSHRLTPVNPTNVAIGGTYNVEYNSNIHNSPSYLNNEGEWIPGYDWGGGTWND